MFRLVFGYVPNLTTFPTVRQKTPLPRLYIYPHPIKKDAQQIYVQEATLNAPRSLFQGPIVKNTLFKNSTCLSTLEIVWSEDKGLVSEQKLVAQQKRR